jgi:hypothetical protein
MGHIMKCIKPQGYILEKKIVNFNFKAFFFFFFEKKKKIIAVAQPPLWATWGGRITPLAKMWVAGHPQWPK